MRQIQQARFILYPILKIGLVTLLSADIEIKEGESATKDITTNTGECKLKFLGSYGSYTGNITANGGNNKIVFEKDGVFGFNAKLNANESSTNTLIANHDITLQSDIVLSGTNTSQTGGNIFDIDGKGLELKDEELKTIKVNSGSSHIYFKSNQSTLAGNIKTLQGNITLETKENTKAIFLGDLILHTNTVAKILLGNSSNLTLQGSTVEISEIALTQNNGNATILIDGKNSRDGVEVSIGNSLKAENVNFILNGSYESEHEKYAQLTLNANDNTIKSIALGEHSQFNVINLTKGYTSINSQIIINNQQELSLIFDKDTALTLSSGISNSGELKIKINDTNSKVIGNITTNNNGETSLYFGEELKEMELIDAQIGLITNNGERASTTLFFKANQITLKNGNDTETVNFSSGANTFVFDNPNGSTLNWQSHNGEEQPIKTIGGNTTFLFQSNGTITSNVNTSAGMTVITLTDGVIATFQRGITTTSKGRTLVDLSEHDTVFVGDILTDGTDSTTTLKVGKNSNFSQQSNYTIQGNIITNSGKTKLEFDGSNNTLILTGNASLTSIANPKNGKNNGISFYYKDRKISSGFKTLTIGSKKRNDGINGEGLNFVVYAVSNQNSNPDIPKTYADKVIINSTNNTINDKNNPTIHTLGVIFANQDSINPNDITYSKGAYNNILVASVANDSNVSLDTSLPSVLGFEVATINYTLEDTGEYTNYYIGGIGELKIPQAEQEIGASALVCNYNLYIATFNSLNKRMGELRDNPFVHGGWARIFHGAQNNDFGVGSKTYYTTLQSGYDYGFEGGVDKGSFRDYLGVALSYAFSTSNLKDGFYYYGEQRNIKDINSQSIEIALYNTYIQDEGWYNDTLIKFGYFLSNFTITHPNHLYSANHQIQNLAFVLNNEIGYLFKLGKYKEWSITPQIELGFGYFNPSHFRQSFHDSLAYLNSTSDSLLTLRKKIGSSFGYAFNRFTQDKNFKINLYLGLFYEHDFITGGELQMNTQRGTEVKKKSDISSDNRFIINTGCNLGIQENTRIYFDIEKSFGGKITTEYQINLGVRYSFGEKD